MARSPEKKPAHNQRKTAGKSWASLTWDDLDRWTGDRSVQRGRQYERPDRVRDLAIAEDGRLRNRLERLNELGHHDAILPLGREIIERGMRQIEQSQDEGETAEELTECMSAILQAVARSSLPAPRKLLYVIDARLKDEYDIIGTI